MCNSGGGAHMLRSEGSPRGRRQLTAGSQRRAVVRVPAGSSRNVRSINDGWWRPAVGSKRPASHVNQVAPQIPIHGKQLGAGKQQQIKVPPPFSSGVSEAGSPPTSEPLRPQPQEDPRDIFLRYQVRQAGPPPSLPCDR